MSKLTKPIIRIHNIETDEIIDREMTDAEYDQYQIDQADYEARKVEAEAKAAEKQAILNRIGLTADELKMILG